VDYKHPTVSTLTEYLIASDSPESALIAKNFEEYKDFGKEQPKPDTNNKMAVVGATASNSYVYSDDDDFAYPPY
jgi:hypothetical protein